MAKQAYEKHKEQLKKAHSDIHKKKDMQVKQHLYKAKQHERKHSSIIKPKIYRYHRVVAPWLIRAICREDNKHQKYRPLKSRKQWEIENPKKEKDDGRISPSEESESDEEIVYYKDVMEKLEAEAKESQPGFIDQTIFVRQLLRE